MFLGAASDLTENDFSTAADAFMAHLVSTNVITAFVGEITCVPRSGQPPTLLWLAAPGRSYEVEFKQDLTDATWQKLNMSVVIKGNQASATDFACDSNHRFYRIVAH